MAPSRARVVDDPKDILKERTAGGTNKQKTRVSNILVASGASKDNVSPASSIPPAGPLTGATPTVSNRRCFFRVDFAKTTQIHWSTQSSQTLNAYRVAHKLDIPPAFNSTLNAAVLTARGIGRRSPTMLRTKQKKKIPKETLVLAVRKHFNSSAVHESDVLVDFIYATKNQGAYLAHLVESITLTRKRSQI